ncbi:MAG: hypothetical protein LUC97_03215 [Clostridiales bacterium]|nr:hypothetical protein [Clostridiales bacterium]
MSTKIVVFQMKDLVKRGIFIAAGIIIIIAILLFLNSGDDKTSYIPGTYSAEIILQNSPVVIEVSVDESSILDIAMLNLGETQEVFYPLFEPSFEALRTEILSAQTTDIEITENTVTSSTLLEAVNAALEEAKKDGNKDSEETTKTA